MNEATYKGYVIHATPKQLRDSGKWNMDLTITKHHGNHVAEKKLFAANTFDTEDEAIKHCIGFGKQVINGQVAKCTVDDL